MKFKIVKQDGGHHRYEFALWLYVRDNFMWMAEAGEYFYKGGEESEEELIFKLIDHAKKIESKNKDVVVSKFTVKNGLVVSSAN